MSKSVSCDFPQKVDSWKVLGKHTFAKELDKSAFLHHGTGVPIEIRQYFDIVDLKPGEKRYATFVFKDATYEVFFVMDRQPTPRTRLFWKSDFSGVIKAELAWWHNVFSKDLEAEHRPLMYLERNIQEIMEYGVHFADPLDFELSDSEEQYQSEITSPESLEDYVPPLRNEELKVKGSSVQPPRSSKEGNLALTKANFICEVDGSHTTFMTEQSQWYMEKHHLIPMEQYYNHAFSIDHYSNIYSLCPTCHRRIHHGSKKDKRNLIEKLFIQREDNFRQVYKIDFAKMLSFYGI